MSKFRNYEKLIGITAEGNATEIKNDTEAVADFICEKGLKVTSTSSPLTENAY